MNKPIFRIALVLALYTCLLIAAGILLYGYAFYKLSNSPD